MKHVTNLTFDHFEDLFELIKTLASYGFATRGIQIVEYRRTKVLYVEIAPDVWAGRKYTEGAAPTGVLRRSNSECVYEFEESEGYSKAVEAFIEYKGGDEDALPDFQTYKEDQPAVWVRHQDEYLRRLHNLVNDAIFCYQKTAYTQKRHTAKPLEAIEDHLLRANEAPFEVEAPVGMDLLVDGFSADYFWTTVNVLPALTNYREGVELYVENRKSFDDSHRQRLVRKLGLHLEKM